MLDNYEFMRRFVEQTPPEQVRPPRLITGEDLKALGFDPGPAFKAILDAVEEAQLEGRIHTPEDAIRLVQESFIPRH
jgi:poly(A) polymerase